MRSIATNAGVAAGNLLDFVSAGSGLGLITGLGANAATAFGNIAQSLRPLAEAFLIVAVGVMVVAPIILAAANFLA